MKFSCGKSKEWKTCRLMGRLKEKAEYKRNWHRAFAWLPTSVAMDESGNSVCIWLEHYERRYPDAVAAGPQAIFGAGVYYSPKKVEKREIKR